MKIITKEMLNELIQVSDTSLISIYMPTHRMGREMQQDPIRLKNLISKAEINLQDKGLRKSDIEKILESARSLLTDTHFWQHQSDGLALFISTDLFQYYRLPIDFTELLVIAERFHLKPLFPMLSGDGQFYVLGLSQNDVRLLQGSRYSIDEVDLEDVPTSLSQALWFDDPEKQLQFHTGTRTAGAAGERRSMYHGHGVSNDDKTNLLRYFQRVDQGLKLLLQENRYPLVLAGVDYLLPIYQQASDYPSLVNTFIEGNPDELSAKEIHQRAWEIMEPIFKSQQHQAMERFTILSSSGSNQASADIESIVPAAHYGRIETLFVALDVQLWGKFDPHKNQIEQHESSQPKDQDLLDVAAVQTLINGGKVYALEPDKMPAKTPVAAIFRYRDGE